MRIKQLIIPRETNDIQELLISYGLFSILLDMNYEFPVTLKRKKGAYIIDLEEEVETEDIIVIPTEKDTDIKNLRFNKMVNVSEFETHVTKLFGTPDEFGDYTGGFFTSEDNTISNIFSYYATFDEQYIKRFNKDGGSYLTGVYTGKGIRNAKGADGYSLRQHVICISMLGYYRTTSCIKVGKKGSQITWLAIPSEKGLKYINKWNPYIYPDKETGELKLASTINNISETVTSAALKVQLQLEISMTENLEDFYGYYELAVVPTSNKPLNDKVKIVTWMKASEKLLVEVSKLLSYSDISKDVKEAVAKFINNTNNYKNYSGMVQILAKKSKYPVLEIKETKEIAKMVNKQNLLELKAIQDYAVMLNEFMYRDMGIGYQSQRELMSVSNSSKLLAALSNMNVLYARRYKHFEVDEVSVKELYTLVLDGTNQISKDVANAILLLSTVKTEDYIRRVENNRLKREKAQEIEDIDEENIIELSE